MKQVNIDTNRFTIIQVGDEPSEGGACHEYYVVDADHAENSPPTEHCHVFFQKGPVKEEGTNGCHNEDLLAIVLHRLKGFQSGKLACQENALAITKIEEAMHWLNHRTASRQQRGVEGTREK